MARSEVRGDPGVGAIPPRAGDSALSFTLPRGPGEIVDLDEALGREKIVLLFFPLAFSSVCTAELGRVRDDWEAWQGLGARVFGISVDSPFVNRRFREELALPFPLLSDFNRTVSAAWGVLYEEFYGLRGVTKRAAFVIGRDRRIAWAWIAENADLEPDYDQLLAAVAAAP